MKSLCYVDVDNVLADFTSAAILGMGETPSLNFRVTRTKFYKDYGKTRQDFWDACESSEFWRDLKPYPWAHALVNMIDDITLGYWRFVTAPMKNPAQFQGKAQWILNHFESYFEKYIICGLDHEDERTKTLGKSVLCRSNFDYLIDDSRINVEEWRQAGGLAFHWEEITADYDEQEVRNRLEVIKFDLLEIKKADKFFMANR